MEIYAKCDRCKAYAPCNGDRVYIPAAWVEVRVVTPSPINAGGAVQVNKVICGSCAVKVVDGLNELFDGGL